MKMAIPKFRHVAAIFTALLLTFSLLPRIAFADGEDNINFPDSVLKQKLLAKGVDTNADGEISQQELSAVTGMLDLNSVSGKKIQRLDGLEYADNVTGLNLKYNYVTDLSILMGMDGLQSADVTYNYLDPTAGSADMQMIASLQAKGVTITNAGQQTISVNYSGSMYYTTGSAPGYVYYDSALVLPGATPVNTKYFSFAGWDINQDGTVDAGAGEMVHLAPAPMKTSIKINAILTGTPEGNEPVNIPDAALKAQFREFDYNKDGVMSRGEMASMTCLSMSSNSDIKDLAGIQYAEMLEDLSLMDCTGISDLTPLASCPALKTLNIDCTRTYDLKALAGLDLEYFYGEQCRLTDISTLAGMPSLKEAMLRDNFLDTDPGSDDMAVINSLLARGITSWYNDQNQVEVQLKSDRRGAPGYTTMNLAYGKSFTLPSITAVDDSIYSFTGWDADNDGIKDYDAGDTFTADQKPVVPIITLNAVYTSHADADIPIDFADPDLKEAIISWIDLNGDGDITRGELGSYDKTLTIHADQVSDLSGMEYAKNLSGFTSNYNSICDLSPLAGLTKLKTLQILDNPIADISPLRTMTGLESISIHTGLVTDISALYDLPNLAYLDVSGNNIKNLNGLTPGSFPSLKEANLSGNALKATGNIGMLANLEKLNMGENAITDISQLAGSQSIKTLTLDRNHICDISSIKDLPQLTLLSISYNYLDPTPGSADMLVADYIKSRGITVYCDSQSMIQIDYDTLSKGTASESPMYVYSGKVFTLATVKTNSNNDIFIGWDTNADGIADKAGGENQVFETTDPIITVTAVYRTGTGSNSILVNIPDSNLRGIIRTAVDANADGIITRGEMANLTGTLDLHSRSIGNLTGLEYADNITTLNLSDNQISDVSVLPGMDALKSADLTGNYLDATAGSADMSVINALTAKGCSISMTPQHQITVSYDVDGLGEVDRTSDTLYFGQAFTPPHVNVHFKYDSFAGWDTNGDGKSDIAPDTASAVGSMQDYTMHAVYTNLPGGEQSVQIPDSTLCQKLRAIADTNGDGNLTYRELGMLKGSLDLSTASGTAISNLSGLENADNITTLNLSHNQIADIQLLTDMAALTSVDLTDNLLDLSNGSADSTNITALEAKGTTVTRGTQLQVRVTYDTDGKGTAERTSDLLYFNQSFSPPHVDVFSEYQELLGWDTDADNMPEVTEGTVLINDHKTDFSIKAIYSADPAGNVAVNIPDSVLLAKLKPLADINNDGKITRNEMAALTGTLNLYGSYNSKISDLTGMEYADAVTTLSIQGNFISDITPLLDMASMTNLTVTDNYLDPTPGSADDTACKTLQARGVSILGLTAGQNHITVTFGGPFINTSASNVYIYNGGMVKLPAATVINPTYYTFEGWDTNGDGKVDGVSGDTLAVSSKPCASTWQVKAVCTATSDAGIPVNIPDTYLKAALIERKVDINNDGIISRGELGSVTSLELICDNCLDLTGLEYATKCTGLDLMYCEIKSIAPLSNLTELKYLNISETSVTDLSPLANCTKLESLQAEYSYISDLTPLAGLQKLNDLYLEHCYVTDIHALIGLNALDNLNIDENYLDETPSSTDMADIATLRTKGVNLYSFDGTQRKVSVSYDGAEKGSPQKSSESVWHGGVAVLPTVQEMDSTLFTFAGWDSNNDGVKDFDPGDAYTVNGNPSKAVTFTALYNATDEAKIEVNIPDAMLKTYYHLDRDKDGKITRGDLGMMRYLDLTPPSSNYYIHSLSGLEYAKNLVSLDMYYQDVSNLWSLQTMTKLQSLNICCSYPTSLEPLRNMTEMRELHVCGSGISDISPLVNMTKLTNLYMDGTKVSDISVFAGMRQLTEVWLYGDMITDASQLLALPPCQLHVQYNYLNLTEGSDDYNVIQTLRQRLYSIEYSPQNKVKVSYDAGAYGTATKGSDTVYSGESVTLPGIVPISDMMDFAGWKVKGSDLPLIPSWESFKVDTTEPVTLTAVYTLSQAGKQPSAISDNNLKNALLAKGADTDKDGIITRYEMSQMKGTLDLNNRGISDLSGLGDATDITALYLNDNNISSVNAISDLNNLTSLSLGWNHISDISPLQHMVKLTDLGLGSNHISDISTVANFHLLQRFSMDSNQVCDISAIRNLTNLTWLDLSSNHSIQDISALSGLTNLVTLQLSNNGIQDISALSGMSKLDTLYIYSNQIRDISPLAHLNALEYLDIGSNLITDMSPASTMPRLYLLCLSNNRITHVADLSGRSTLFYIGLEYNYIDTSTGSADMAIINKMTDKYKTVYYSPQRKITVSFNTDGKGQAACASQQALYNTSITLPDVTPQHGLAFLGWDTNGDGSLDAGKGTSLVIAPPDFANLEFKAIYTTAPPSSNTYLARINIDGYELANFSKNKDTYSITRGYSCTQIDLGAVPDDAYANITGLGKIDLVPGNNICNITVTAENGTATQTYHVNVYRKKGDTALASLSVNGTPAAGFSPAVTAYNLGMVPYDTTAINITAAANDSAARVTGTGIQNLSPGTNLFHITVFAEDELVYNTYTISISRSTEPTIKSMSLNVSAGSLSSIFNPDTTSYTLVLDEFTPSTSINLVPANNGDSFYIDGARKNSKTITLSAGKSKTVTIKHYSPTGSLILTYNILVKRTISDNNLLSRIDSTQPLAEKFDPYGQSLNVYLDEFTQKATITPVKSHPYATVYINGRRASSATYSVTNGSTVPVKIKVVAQNGASRYYTLNINRARSTNADLLWMKTSSSRYPLTPVFSAGNLKYTVTLPSNVNTIAISGKQSSKYASISIDQTGKSSKKIVLARGQEIQVHIYVTAQAGNINDYIITIKRL